MHVLLHIKNIHRHYNWNPREMYCMLQVQTKQQVLQTSKPATSGWESSTMSLLLSARHFCVWLSTDTQPLWARSHLAYNCSERNRTIWSTTVLFRAQKCYSDNKQNHHPSWTMLTAIHPKPNTTGLHHWVFIPLYQWEVGCMAEEIQSTNQHQLQSMHWDKY